MVQQVGSGLHFGYFDMCPYFDTSRHELYFGRLWDCRICCKQGVWYVAEGVGEVILTIVTLWRSEGQTV